MSEPILGIEPKQKITGGVVGVLVCAIIFFVGWFVPCLGCFIDLLAGLGVIACLVFIVIGVVEMNQSGESGAVKAKSKTVSVKEKKKK